ncbi:hypothetical protein [Krasilnikovia sp. M28-CT-15]
MRLTHRGRAALSRHAAALNAIVARAESNLPTR